MGLNLLSGLASALQGQPKSNSLNTAQPSVAGSVLSNMMGNRQSNTWGQPSIGSLAALLQPKEANAAGLFGNGSPTGNRGEDNSIREYEAWDEADKYLSDVNRKRKLRGLEEIDGSTYVNLRLKGKTRDEITQFNGGR